MFSSRRAVAAAGLVHTIHTAAFAQVTTADIVCRVTDASGAVLPGVTVTVENVGTHETRVVPTGASGDYTFNVLPIGRYTVKIELQGFTTQNAALVLAAGDRARLDVKLQLGAVAENVTVTAESPLVQTDSSTLSSLVTEKAVQDLPVNGRNFAGSSSSFRARPKAWPIRWPAARGSTTAARRRRSRSTDRSTTRTTSCSMASTTTSGSSAR
jgi:hypothetical protein